ncbi:methionine--tRNA ligase [Planosporangium mesophilum]|uniref:methionine--tRNA ligase n=1 Tax=Planosporangium mesophilum TaxID=689768 RepID=A0A8J3TAP3_9ACTN|nr:methionine--tRNA ligase [Planosporangium mesophilum]NJC82993.1 methionine--tRNA ligase [Planosporangium mesophilum]GII22397.1 methionine--tRNA ligase [Planosporangium mesophilum]
MTRTYLTTTLPYVNARPHLGFALELVQADVLARHHRRRGDEVWSQTGTDENSLKNVLAAQAAGVPVADLVDRNASAFADLGRLLDLSLDDFVRTGRDARHRAGVHRLWRDCAAAGDLYRRYYEGLYCVGCEQFYEPGELPGGVCPEHNVAPQPVAEENWFFRLSRYRDRLREVIATGRLRVEPESRRNEVLAFLDGGLRDLSVSRSRARARGWGIEVPDDPGQVVYVWWDALGNYVSGPGYGTGDEAYRRWWVGADRRVHLLGKGVLRFHAVYWPAMLLSAGLPLPTEIFVHDYLTAGGAKISKSSGTGAEPSDLVARYGTDAVRWWLLREVPRVGDVEFTPERLVARANSDLANGLGNLVNRVVAMVHRCGGGRVPEIGITAEGAALRAACDSVGGKVDAALAVFDFRRAAGAVWEIVTEANRYVERVRPWELAAAGRDADLDGCLGLLVAACRCLAVELAPFLPGLAGRVAAQCAGEVLAPARPLFVRIGQ